MDTIFTIKGNQIGALAPQVAVTFFRDLLWSEARKLGIPISKVQISLWVSMPDGGIDASVSETELVKTSGLIKTGQSGYQIKTGTSFQPWQDAQIKKELFGGKQPSKESLGKGIRTCLDNEGTYILVCFGQELTDVQHQQAVNGLISQFKQCGYTDPKVEVWGQSTIIGYTQSFPSLVLQLQGFDDSKFQTHKSWSQQDDMRKELKTGEAQLTFISNLQTELRRNDQAVHLRIWGEPGSGKTRLILEATGADDLKSLVVYCDSADKFRDSNLMNEIIKEDNMFSMLLVVDECDPDSRSYIWNKLKNLGSRIKMISIYNEYDDSSGTISYFDTPLLEKEQISNIIQEYGILKDQADRWSELCSGSPRVAHVIGWNLKNNPDDVLKPLDTVNIWDRYIVGGDDPQDNGVKQRAVVLQHIALFKKFGFGRLVIKEAQAIAGIVEQADRQITWSQFQQIVKRLRERKILQGETTLYITPKALHIKLWKDWWDTFGNSFNFEEFSKNIPDPLREWFYEMFKYAAESDAAAKIVEDLLGENGPFQKDNYLRNKLGADFFLALTEANPKAAVKCLQNTIGKWSKDELLNFKEGRRQVVWALERTAVWKEHFKDSARLLLNLGEAENESYSNSASGIFIDLFSPGPSGLAPTEASPEERFPILQEALNSDSKEKRMIALSACDKALEANSFVRMVGAEYQGLREARLWRPESREEIMEAYSRIWQLLYSSLDKLSEDEQRRAVEVMLNNIRGLIPAPELASMIIDDVTNLADKPYGNKKEIIKTIEEFLHYDRKELPDEIRQQWEKLRDNLVGKDFPSLMRRYVEMDILEDNFDDDGNRVDKAAEHIKDLAHQVVVNNDLLKPELPWLVTHEAKNGFRFSYELGLQDQDFTLLPLLLDAQCQASDDKNTSDYFLGGYLRVLFEKNPEQWEKVLDELSEDKKLGSWISGLTWRSGMSDRAAVRILKLAQNGILKAKDFRVFGFGSVIKNLSEKVFKEWIEFLLETPDDIAASIALDLYHFYYIRKDSEHKLPNDLTLKLLTNPSLFKKPEEGRRDQMEDHNWTEISNRFIELYPEDSLQLADTILEHFGEDGTIFEGYHSPTTEVINNISSKNPNEMWKKVTKFLGPPIDSRSFHLTHWLREKGFFEEGEGSLSSFNPESVWEWVNEDPEKRSWYLATFVPKVLFKLEGKTCWARELLVKYGERKEVRNELTANFSSEGWSGPASQHYQQKKDSLLSFKEGEDNENVKQWIDDFVASLDKQIEYEKVIEERMGF